MIRPTFAFSIHAALAAIVLALPLMAQAQTSDRAVPPGASGVESPNSGNILVIELKDGPVQIQLRPDLAPKHVARVKQLAQEKFYDGIKFHRVIERFMAQTGDPTGTGSGGSKYGSLPAEFSSYTYKRGTVGAARTSDPNSSNSQFYICFDDNGCLGLTGQYTVWGQVISGMESVDKIKRGSPGSGIVTDPDVMQKVYLLSDKK